MHHAIWILVAFLSLVPAEPQDPGVPEDVRGFSGQVTGVVGARHDDGSFSLRVTAVTRVWKDNAATNIEWFTGRTIRIGPQWAKGEDGQWRRVEPHARFIATLREQDDLRLEIRFAERDRFAILELSQAQRQVAQRSGARARDRGRDAVRLAEGISGFSGQVGGIVRAKHDDGTFTFEVVKVHRVWEGSTAARPEALAGTTVRVGPRTVRGDDGASRPAPLHVAFVRELVDGEDYRLEVRNVEGDRFQILELSQEQRERARRSGDDRRRRSP